MKEKEVELSPEEEAALTAEPVKPDNWTPNEILLEVPAFGWGPNEVLIRYSNPNGVRYIVAADDDIVESSRRLVRAFCRYTVQEIRSVSVENRLRLDGRYKIQVACFGTLNYGAARPFTQYLSAYRDYGAYLEDYGYGGG